jgi:hypothetical protein
MAKKSRGGIVFDNIEPGAFYQCSQPGGFTDTTTGIHVPGPKVKLDEVNKRQVVGISDLPDPIQMPHKKEVYDYKDKDRKVREKAVVPFDRKDEYPFHEAFQMALSTGILRKVEDEDVEKFYPAAWEARQTNIVYTNEIAITPMADLIDQHQETLLTERLESAKAEQQAGRAAAKRALGKPKREDEESSTDGEGSPPPPPPA